MVVFADFDTDRTAGMGLAEGFFCVAAQLEQDHAESIRESGIYQGRASCNHAVWINAGRGFNFENNIALLPEGRELVFP